MKKFFLFALTLLFFTVSASELRDLIKAAAAANKNYVKLEKKVYRLKKSVNIENISNLTVDGNGAEIVMLKNDIPAFRLINSENIVIKNLSVDYDPLPFTQGVVTKVDGNKFTFTIDDGYPKLSKDFQKSYIHLFDSKGEWKKNSADVYGKMQILTPETAEFTVRGKHVVEKGDRVAVNFRSPAAFSISRCGKLEFSHINIYASPGVAFHSRYGRGKVVFDTVKIIRKKDGRLFACCADGINLATSSGGAEIRNCEFSYLGDDGINFHSELLPVAVKRDKKRLIFVYPYGQYKTHFEEVFKKGDEMIFVRQGDYKIIGRAHLESIKVSSDRKPEKLAPEFFPVRGTSGVSVYELTTLEETDIPRGSFFYIPASGVENFVISNNFFHDHRARGIRIMSSCGVIENNLFERLKTAAVTLGGEFNYWREAGWCSDIVIRNNVMREIGYSAIVNADNYVPGVISTFARLDGRKFIPVPENRNLVIENNLITDSPGAAIFLYAADKVVLKNNKIEKCATSKTVPGRNLGFKNFAPIWIQNSAEVTKK